MKFFWKINSLFFLTLVLTFLSLSSNAQLSGLSSYSRFGLGTLNDQNMALHMGMGGVAVMNNTSATVNVLNPSTYAGFFRPTFQVELRNQFLTVSNESESQSLRLTTINSFNFVFPFGRSKAALSIGVLPYSRSGYDIVIEENNEDLGDLRYNYEGEGGVNRAYLGLAKAFDIRSTEIIRDTSGKAVDTLISLKHKLSIGGNFNYYFGNLQKTRSLEFDNPDYFNSRFTASTRLQDIGFDFGIHYFTTLLEKRKRSELIHKLNLNFGASYALATDVNVEQTELAETYRLFAGIPNPLDTTFFLENADGSLTIPQFITAGVGLEYLNKNDRSLKLGIEYRRQDWSDFRYRFNGTEIDDPSLDASSSLAVGLEFTPKFLPKPGLNIFQKMSYRFGARTNDTYLQLNGQEITEEILSMGFSIPLEVSRSSSKINFGMEFGQRGSTTDGLIREEFINLQLGFTFTPYYRNNWFVQSKYD